METINAGLDGIVVAETRLSGVDGERGRLVLCGHAVEELAGTATFEDAAALFLNTDSADARCRLGAARVRASQNLSTLPCDDVMVALRAALARPGIPAPAKPGRLSGGIPFAEPTASHPGPEDPWSAIGEIAVELAAWWRRRSGQAPLAPDPEAAHADDVLRLLGGTPTAFEVRALNTYLVTVIDHGMNASTFAARVVASTGSDQRSSLVAGLGALKGPLHGGAPGPVLDMLDKIETADKARAFLKQELDAGRRIMGMGHRVYRVRDPRAFVLEGALAALSSRRIDLGRVVEREAEHLLAERHPGRRLSANVELFTALLLDALGIDRLLFTALFASSRVVGWCAHVAEQRQSGRLIRPASRYTGAAPGA